MPVSESWRNVGRKIRYLRKRHQLTIKQLAAGCGLSPNAISLLERGEVAPTVATLCKIASALGAPASSFFQDICPNEVILTRAQDRCAGQSAKSRQSSRRKQPADQVLRALTCPTALERDLSVSNDLAKTEPAEQETEENQESPPIYSHEFVLCLSGRIEYQANGQTYHLEPGDSLSFNGNVLHCWRNSSSDTAVAVMVLNAKAALDLDLEGE